MNPCIAQIYMQIYIRIQNLTLLPQFKEKKVKNRRSAVSYEMKTNMNSNAGTVKMSSTTTTITEIRLPGSLALKASASLMGKSMSLL